MSIKPLTKSVLVLPLSQREQLSCMGLFNHIVTSYWAKIL